MFESSTPLGSNRLKSASHKQLNHTKLRNLTSPYYNHRIQTANTPNKESNLLEYENYFINQGEERSQTENNNPPTTPISSMVISSESSFETSKQTSRSSSFNSLDQKSAYSDIPDSPGQAYAFYSKPKDFSVLTIDSNQSKSNDITIIERTIHASQTNSYYFQDEVVTYDLEESICDSKSTRSNVSCLTFANEPTADLAFLRNLLEKKNSNPKPWGNFTPPVKLQETTNSLILPNTQEQPNVLSRALFKTYEFNDQEEDKDSCKVYNNEEEEEDRESMASVPSIVRNDMENNLDKSNFKFLLEKIKPIESNSPVLQEQIPLVRRGSLNNTYYQEEEEEEEEDDEKILFEFIDECYGQSKEDKENEEIINEINEHSDLGLFQNFQYMNPLKQVENRFLPKIIEEENECDQSRLSVKNKVKSKLLSSFGSTNSLSSVCSANSKQPVVVKLTKTALLRANKLKETQQQKTKQTARPWSSK